MSNTPDTPSSIREVRRDQAAERRRIREQRSLAQNRRDQATKQVTNRPFILRQNAVVTGLVPRISGAIDSWAGKRVPLSVQHPAHQFYAYTDFTSISISIPALREDQEMTVDFAADLRGLAYHEAGHIIKTVPFVNIVDEVLPLADGFSPERRERTMEALWGSKDALHHAWNMLEDQRMESSMVRESKNLGRYYNVIVLTHILDGDVSPNAYLLLYGRKHVSQDVRDRARIAFAAVQGEAMTVEVERLIDAYKAADNLLDMWQCVVKFSGIVYKAGEKATTPDDLDGHNDDGGVSEGEASKRLEASNQPADGEAQDDDGEGQGPASDDDGDDEADGDEGDDEADEGEDDQDGVGSTADRSRKGEGSDGNGAADHSSGEAVWNRDVVRDAIRKGKDERNNDRTIVGDVRAFNEALAKAGSSLPIKRIPVIGNPDPAVTFEANKLNRALRNLMDQARAERAPSWQQNQRSGVLDVIRYKTRQAGDMEFFRSYADGGDMHLPNMAVSLVLDGSGSMYSYGEALAQAAFGVKSACDVIGVPCTVTVYDTDAYLLWDKDDRPIDVPLDVIPGGGTDPKAALDLLDSQMADKDHHLVIIMTDGAWGGRWHKQLSLAHYMVPHRDMVLFFWNTSTASGPQGMEACSTTARINSLDEMPNFLRRYIMRAL